MKKVVSFSPEADTGHRAIFKKLSKVVGFEDIIFDNLKDIFSVVNQDADIGAVILNIDYLNNTNIIDIINSIETLRDISKHSRVNIIAYSNSDVDANTIRKIIRSGITGFAIVDNHMSFEDKIEFLSDALAGQKYLHKYVKEKISTHTSKKNHIHRESSIVLTPRQQEVLDLVCSRGASNKSIARILNLSESTVKLHIGAILKKYGLTNRTQLALFGKKN